MPGTGPVLLPARRAPSTNGRSASRLLGVLLVVLGIIAMHQMAGGTHTATMTGAMPAGMSASSAAASTAGVSLDTTGLHQTARGAAAVGLPGGTEHAPAGADRHPGPVLLSAAGTTAAGAMPLCLAVLAGLLLIGLPGLLARRAPAGHSGRPRVTSRQSRPAGRGPPRDLLAQLCVLRT